MMWPGTHSTYLSAKWIGMNDVIVQGVTIGRAMSSSLQRREQDLRLPSWPADRIAEFGSCVRMSQKHQTREEARIASRCFKASCRRPSAANSGEGILDILDDLDPVIRTRP
jgi:hypothetical protein